MNVEVVRDTVLGTLLSLVADPIPNIRFNVAKSLETLSTTYGTTPDGKTMAEEKIKPALTNLQNDLDADVRYFANRALEHTNAIIACKFLSRLYDCSL